MPQLAEPLVTVVVPLHNGAEYLGETLDSIAAQTYKAIEVVVVDDGSTDRSIEVARAHRVGARILEQKHLGVAVARNRGLAEASGKWITFLDQDDLWHPERIARLVDWLGDHQDQRIVITTEIAFAMAEETAALATSDPLVASWASVVVSAKGAYETLVRTTDTSGSACTEYFDHRALLRGPVTVTTSFMADPLLLKLAGGFAPHALAMDDYWLLVNVSRIQPIARIDSPSVFYRIHARATSRTTRLALPFLSSAVALRLGGGVVPLEYALSGDTTGPLHRHLLSEMLESPDMRSSRYRSVARSLAALLWTEGTAKALVRAELRRRAPTAYKLARTFRRSLLRSPSR
ncbi:glycosyltransferase family 2 protein [Georgenia muralis]